MEDLERFETLEHYFGKTADLQAPTDTQLPADTSTHEYVRGNKFISNQGGSAVFNIWNPFTEQPEFSLSQMWVVRGSGSNKQTVEAGWQRYPSKYGDVNTHLFIYSTSDNYDTTGCYNLDCGSFVQTNNTVVIGGTLTSSVRDGVQKIITLDLHRGSGDGNWWLRVNGTWVGYYPSSTLFDSAGLLTSAERVSYGGEIADTHLSTFHTQTAMGSGYPASQGYLRAAYIRNMRYKVNNSTVPDSTGMSPLQVTNTNCYEGNLNAYGYTNWGQYLFHGGFGLQPQCP